MAKSKTKSVIVDSIPNIQTEYVRLSNIVGQKYHIALMIIADIIREAPNEPSVIKRRAIYKNKELKMMDPQIITDTFSVMNVQ